MKKFRTLFNFFILVLIISATFIGIVLYDQPVDFPDPNLELIIRQELNHFYKPIFRSQLLGFVELDLENKKIKDITGLEHFRNLEVLNLRGNELVNVNALSNLAKLRTLDLGYNHLVDLKVSNFDKLGKLKIINLNLDHNVIEYDDKPTIRLSNIGVLNSFDALEHLSLVDNDISDISPLANMTNLKVLDLEENSVKKVDALSGLRFLEELNLKNNQIEDISGIENSKALNYINLHSNTKIQDLSPLKNLVNLNVLILRNVPVGENLNVIENLTNLIRLNLRNCGVNDVSVLAQLMSKGAIQDNPDEETFAYLDLLENPLPNDPFHLQSLSPYWDNIHTTYPTIINDSVLDPPVFSVDSGFYIDPFYLDLHSTNPDSVIYYTVDGSIPTKESKEYREPIFVDIKNSGNQQIDLAYVIRARVFERAGYETSPTMTKTYFPAKSNEFTHNLAVVSMVTDPKNLYDQEFGIASIDNFRERGKKWERPLHLEFFSVSGEKEYEQDLLLRLHGQASRNLPQKSFRIYGENNYAQEETINYEFFPELNATSSGKPINQFKTLIFRNSGNDWGMTMFRDALIQKLVEHTSMDIQAYRPVHVYLNGQYWGILNIRERLDEYYIENHYDISPGNATIHEVTSYDDFYAQAPHENEFLGFIDYIRKQSDIDETLYEEIKHQVDLENFIDNQIIYLYAANRDWIKNNVRFWKKDVEISDTNDPYGHDGRWRWMVNDMDFGFRDYEINMLPVTLREAEGSHLISTLMKYPKFKNDFINRFADLLNTSFSPDRVINEIDKMETYLEMDIIKHIDRWNSIGGSVDVWHQNVTVMRQFAVRRPDFVREDMIQTYDLQGTITVNLKTLGENGYVKINSIELNAATPGVEDPANWSGIYFKDIPLTLTAIPQPGFSFSHWEGVEVNDPSKEIISVIPDSDLQIIAVFEEVR